VITNQKTGWEEPNNGYCSSLKSYAITHAIISIELLEFENSNTPLFIEKKIVM
jgi:hypothetical protein